MPYSLCEDYNKLYDLLLDGERVAGYVDYKFHHDSSHTFRDLCNLIYENGELKAYVRGKGYFTLGDLDVKIANRMNSRQTNLRELFAGTCKSLNLGWIET